MHLRSQVIRVVATVACSLGLVGSQLSAAQAITDPMYGAPTVGTCRQYTWDALNQPSETSPEVDCAARHDAKVITVFQLPDRLGYDSSGAKLWAVTARHCYPDFNAALGRSEKARDMSAYRFSWYIPTTAQQNNGARWIRCDLNLFAGKALKALPSDTAPMLPTMPLPDSVAGCLMGKRYFPTFCAKTHRYRASNTTRVRSTTYPGHKKYYRVAKRRCPNLVTTPSAWYATWPTRQEWRAGQRLVVCYSKTSS